jgi:hypothetical protein
MADFDIRERVGNGDDPGLQPLYRAINDLIRIAGHVTLDDLFNKSAADLGTDVWKVIHHAKRFGLLSLRNNSCCGQGGCKSSDRGWCSRTKSGECAAASDSCGSEELSLGKLSTAWGAARDEMIR